MITPEVLLNFLGHPQSGDSEAWSNGKEELQVIDSRLETDRDLREYLLKFSEVNRFRLSERLQGQAPGETLKMLFRIFHSLHFAWIKFEDYRFLNTLLKFEACGYFRKLAKLPEYSPHIQKIQVSLNKERSRNAI